MRYNKKDLQTLLDRLNELNGHKSGEIGSFQYYKDFYGYKIHEVANEHGGVRDWPFGNGERTINKVVDKVKTVLAAYHYWNK